MKRGLRSTWQVTRAVVSKGWNDRLLGLSAEAGFWTLLSLPGVLLALAGLAGYVAPLFGEDVLPGMQASILEIAARVFTPEAMQELVAPVVEDTFAQGRADIASLGFAIALWSGSTAMSTYVNTITIAYGMRDLRSAWKSRLVAFLLYIAGIALFVVGLPALVVGPELFHGLFPEVSGSTISLAYWTSIVVSTLVLVTVLYHLSIPVRTRWAWNLPGAVLALVLWVVGGSIVQAYLATVRVGVYGALGAPIAILLLLYIIALAVLFGAELNAVLDSRRANGMSREQWSWGVTRRMQGLRTKVRERRQPSSESES